MTLNVIFSVAYIHNGTNYAPKPVTAKLKRQLETGVTMLNLVASQPTGATQTHNTL